MCIGRIKTIYKIYKHGKEEIHFKWDSATSKSLCFQHSPSSLMVDVEKIKLATRLIKTSSRKRFGEDVCELMTRWNVLIFDDLQLYLLADEVMINLDIIGYSWWTGFLAKLMGAWFSHRSLIGHSKLTLRSLRVFFNHMHSHTPFANDMSSVFSYRYTLLIFTLL